ncbi:hypothetical protein AALP_AA2G036200 [Arabis alpina]|uniref:RRM domain-containing protein n=1 Tax=Arabis alpina TaxID=50452 RepID=A0A087HF49_ARAAL|nr:hypothetical protein AALP_AA2G036200 [Arabis alpina]
MNQQATRHARRIYVGCLPPTATEQNGFPCSSRWQRSLAIGGNTAGPGDSVVNVFINYEKKFAFVEMRSVEEASNAMALDRIILEGVPVKVRRPGDYSPPLAATLGPTQPNPNLNLAAVGLSTCGLEELFECFGPLRGFNLAKDITGRSKGYVFCTYQDPSVTDIACTALNGIKLGDKTVVVMRAIQGAVQPNLEQEEILLPPQLEIVLQVNDLLDLLGIPTKIICLTQVVTANDLGDDEEYKDIMEEMRQEGNLVNVLIPRPNPDHNIPSPGVGKYADVDGASKAKSGIHGRKFGRNQVVAMYYSENKYVQGNYEVPCHGTDPGSIPGWCI